MIVDNLIEGAHFNRNQAFVSDAGSGQARRGHVAGMTGHARNVIYCTNNFFNR